MEKRNIWIFGIEPLVTRYTFNWHTHIQELFKDKLSEFNVIQVDGIQKDTEVTPGAFLNFSDKLLEKFATM